MSGRRTTILCIDDDGEIRFSLGALFRTQGWDFAGAANMESGMALFAERRPDVVLLDYHMPGISGLQGVRMLRGADPDVPILVLTVEESQEVADSFLAAGASDFALKPIRAPDILARINLHLRLAGQTGARGEKEQAYVAKGIVPVTRGCILAFLKEQEDYVTVDEIARQTGLAYQTVSRYLQYMVRENEVRVQSTYGKVGRPRQMYKI